MSQIEIATLAGGCFWGMEDLFRKLPGVLGTEVGYCGGRLPNPKYDRVKTGATGHAETLQIQFDPEKISYLQLLDFFFRIHDPTTVDRQGNDTGTQYRSEIFFHSSEQKEDAEQMIAIVNDSGAWPKPIATKLSAFETFWPAEPEHQDYLEHYPNGYTCHFIRPMPSFLKS